jgi:hypothetical protein
MIKLIANYSKKLGLPNFSSHSFGLSIEMEIVASDDVVGESERLYQRLQESVDQQIQETGFIPSADYGMLDAPIANGKAAANGSAPRQSSAWKCSDKQRDLILKLVEEHQLAKDDVDALAIERFGKGVKLLNRIESSGLIDELIDTYGGNDHDRGDKRRRGGSAYQRDQRRAA